MWLIYKIILPYKRKRAESGKHKVIKGKANGVFKKTLELI